MPIWCINRPTYSANAPIASRPKPISPINVPPTRVSLLTAPRVAETLLTSSSTDVPIKPTRASDNAAQNASIM